MRTTIIADASYCPETNAAGYGFWIAGDRGKMPGEGVLKRCDNSIAAEMMALLNALHQAVEYQIAKFGEVVLMQTDCQAAIQAFTGCRRNMTRQEEGLVKWYKDFTNKHALKVSFRHVKGHTKNKDARSVTNVICDKRAKRNMREARHKLNVNSVLKVLEE